MRTLNRSKAGFTLVEALLAASASIVVAGLIATMLQRSNAVFLQSGAASEADAVAQRAIERITEELMSVDRSTLNLTPSPITGGSTVLYRRTTGFNNGMQVGDLQRMRFEYGPGEINDGIDNDGDGLIDEGRVTLNTDVLGAGTDVVLIDQVSELAQGELPNGLDDNGNGLVDEPGFVMTYDAQTFALTVRLSVSRTAQGGRTIERTAVTAVRLRND